MTWITPLLTIFSPPIVFAMMHRRSAFWRRLRLTWLLFAVWALLQVPACSVVLVAATAVMVPPELAQPKLALTQPELGCTWAPIYEFATITQGPHGMEYGHYAIDVSAGRGASIYAPITGVARQSSDGYANTILTIENDCYVVSMLHGDWLVVGELQQGQLIGTESNNGYTMSAGILCYGRVHCGNHTHISIYDKLSKMNVDPRDLGLVGDLER